MTTATATATRPAKKPATVSVRCPACNQTFTARSRGNATRKYCSESCGNNARRLADAQRYAEQAQREIKIGGTVTVLPGARLDEWTREYRGRTGVLVGFVAGDCALLDFGDGGGPVCLERRDLTAAVRMGGARK